MNDHSRRIWDDYVPEETKTQLREKERIQNERDKARNQELIDLFSAKVDRGGR